MVIGMLAIFKSGGAYVPLDDTLPSERLRFYIQDSQASLLLTTESLLDKFTGLEIPFVCFDKETARISTYPTDNFDSGATPANLAYCMYTSASTGDPKGVMITQAAVSNTLLWRKEQFSIDHRARALQSIPYTFDPSVWQIFTPLISGARLIIARPQGHRDLGYLLEILGSQSITVTDFPPALLKALLEEPDLHACNALRIVFCGGEAMSVELQNKFVSRLSARLFNQYGPTETSIDATSRLCSLEAAVLSVPIGRPIANTQVYILDEWQE